MISLKTLGLILMLVSIVLFITGYSYVKSVETALLQGHELTDSGTCTHPDGAVCPFQKLNELAVPKTIAFFMDLLLFVSGFWLFIQRKPEEKSLVKAQKSARDLGGDEAKIFDIVVSSEGMAFQNELVEKTGLSKVKVTRLLDKLEAKGLVERRRRGMTNVIILKP